MLDDILFYSSARQGRNLEKEEPATIKFQSRQATNTSRGSSESAICPPPVNELTPVAASHFRCSPERFPIQEERRGQVAISKV